MPHRYPVVNFPWSFCHTASVDAWKCTRRCVNNWPRKAFGSWPWNMKMGVVPMPRRRHQRKRKQQQQPRNQTTVTTTTTTTTTMATAVIVLVLLPPLPLPQNRFITNDRMIRHTRDKKWSTFVDPFWHNECTKFHAFCNTCNP